MQIANLQYYIDFDFDKYLALPGVSYSSIKGFDGPPNKGMSLGTQVHNYILEPEKYTWENVAEVKLIAAAIRGVLGSAIDALKKEVAFTCDMEHNGLVMPYKGRADLLYAPRVVVDLKVLSGTLAAAIKHFGYEKQIGGYCLATGCKMGLIISYNKSRKCVEHAIIHPEHSIEWWNYQIVSRCQIPV